MVHVYIIHIARLSDSNKTTAQIYSLQYLLFTCIISQFVTVVYILVYTMKRAKEKNTIMLLEQLVNIITLMFLVKITIDLE